MKYSEINENLCQEIEAPSGEGRTARFTRWLVGPGMLGCHLGCVSAAAAMMFMSIMADFDWDLILLYRFGICSAAGYFGGGIGSLTARDEFLRQTLGRYRPLVGLVTGCMIGALGGAVFLDGWIALAGAIGGGIGGLTNTIIHRNIMETDWW